MRLAAPPLTPAGAPESSAKLNHCIARKTLNQPRRTMRARWSEMAAVRNHSQTGEGGPMAVVE